MIMAVHETVSGEIVRSKMQRAVAMKPHLEYMSRRALETKALPSDEDRMAAPWSSRPR